MKTYDVAIVGGGIIGGSIAFELSQRNLRVAVFDRQEFMREASWAAAGMLSAAPDCPSAIPLVPLGRASLGLYPRFVAAVEEASGLRAGYRTDGALEVLFHGDPKRELSTLVALHHGLGLSCEPLPLEDAHAMEPALGRDARAGAFLPDEASVNSRALAVALLAATKTAGAALFPGTEVTSLIHDGKCCTGVRTAAGETISAGHVVLAAGCWTSQIPGMDAYAPTIPVRGQMVALRHTGKPLRHVLRSERGYIVPRGDASPQNVVAGSTLENAGYEKCVTSGGLEKILQAVNELAPGLAGGEVIGNMVGPATGHSRSTAYPRPDEPGRIADGDRALPQRNSARTDHR